MDNLKENARTFTVKNIEQEHIKEYAIERLVIGHNGGLFRIDPGFITFLFLIDDDKCPIFDMYKQPIMIEDVKSFREEVKGRFFETANEAWKDWQGIDKKYK